MPKRNLLVLVVICLTCLAAFVAREQAAHGRRFAEVLAIIEDSYLDPVDSEELFDVAVDATLARLDEHSAYMRGDDRGDLEATLDQRFGGVGLELAMDDRLQVPVVASPVLDSPAWRAGIRAGDRVESINGQSVAGKPLRDTVAMLRGSVGERVTLVLATPLEDVNTTLDPVATSVERVERRDVTLTREVIATESVLGDRRQPTGEWEWMLEGVSGVGFVRITSFGERTSAEFASALNAIGETRDLRGLVIDLRGNPGGLLSSAVDVCDELLGEGVIVHTRARRRNGRLEEESFDARQASAGARLEGVPVAVLVDGMTASAAEIVAGCLQDSGRATVVGNRTFGKGTVQSIMALSDDRGLLKLTTSEYLRPSGTKIHRRDGDDDGQDWGVLPDAGYEVSPPATVATRLAAWRRGRDAVGPVPAWLAADGVPTEVDPVLVRALDALSRSAPRAANLGREKEASGNNDDTSRSRE